MSVTLLHGTLTREPFFSAGQGDKGSFLSLNVESGTAGRKSWWDVVMFADAADFYSTAFKEGDSIFAVGNASLDTRNKEYPKLKLYVNSIQKVDSGGDAHNAVNAGAKAREELGF